MNRGSTFIVLMIAVVCGMFASFYVVQYVKEIQNQNKSSVVNRTQVIVAQNKIPAGSRLRISDLTIAEWEEHTLPVGVFHDTNELEGRVTNATIYPGEPIRSQRLSAFGSPAGLPALIPQGFRAITLRVDDTIGVGGFILPGHYVDVVTTIDTDNENRDLVSKVILQNVQVLATGKEMEVGTEEDEKKAKTVPTVTVLVSLEHAERLSLATNAGHIRLVLRNNSDKETEFTEGATLANLIPQVNKDVFELPPPEPVMYESPKEEPVKKNLRIIEVYRGGERSEVTFEK